MKKIITVFVLLLFSLAQQTDAQAFQYPPNPSPAWLIMDSSITKTAAFTDTLLKGSHSLYLLQSIDSSIKLFAFTYHFVDGNGSPLNFIYNYVRHNGIKTIAFIEVDGRKTDVMDIFNHYFHTFREWDEEQQNGNIREFVYSQKTYIFRMSENKNADGDPLGTVKSAIMNF